MLVPLGCPPAHTPTWLYRRAGSACCQPEPACCQRRSAGVGPCGGGGLLRDGAGGLGETTDTLAQVIAEEGVPLRVEKVDWSHGEGRFLIDHLDRRNLQTQGGRPGPGGAAVANALPRKPHLFRRAKRRLRSVATRR